jgi:hypothetical protein
MKTRFFGKLSAGLRARWLGGSIDKALAVNRYEVRPDRLLLEGTSFRLAITWRTRGIHPWDGDLAADRKALRMVKQTFSDTLAALDRLFMALPEVDVIDLRVLEADARKHGVLLNGLISRRDFEACRLSSPAMRLRLLGLNFNLVNSRFEPLVPSCSDYEIPSSEINARHRGGSVESAHSSEVGTGPPQTWHQDKAGPH